MSRGRTNGNIHNVYMHLINGRPAYWHPSHKRLYYATGGEHRKDMFRETLAQVRHEQHADAVRCRSQHIDLVGVRYGYLRLRVGNRVNAKGEVVA